MSKTKQKEQGKRRVLLRFQNLVGHHHVSHPCLPAQKVKDHKVDLWCLDLTLLPQFLNRTHLSLVEEIVVKTTEGH